MQKVTIKNSQLHHMLDHLNEDSLYDGFKVHYKKTQNVHALATNFYKQIDTFQMVNSISNSQLIKLEETNKTIMDSFRNYDLNNRFNKIRFKKSKYPFLGKSLENKKLYLLILKNDMMLNEIEVLQSIHNDRYQEGHWERKYVICEETDYSDRDKYELEVLIIGKKEVNYICQLQDESLSLNGVKLPKSVIINKYNNVVQFKSLKPGNYEFSGQYIVPNQMGNKTYPFKHKFIIPEK